MMSGVNGEFLRTLLKDGGFQDTDGGKKTTAELPSSEYPPHELLVNSTTCAVCFSLALRLLIDGGRWIPR